MADGPQVVYSIKMQVLRYTMTKYSHFTWHIVLRTGYIKSSFFI